MFEKLNTCSNAYKLPKGENDYEIEMYLGTKYIVPVSKGENNNVKSQFINVKQ